MTRPDFLTAFATACRALHAELLEHAKEFYPHGPFIRLKVKPPTGVSLPGALDPLTLVWYHQMGDYRSVLDGLQVALGLGLSPAEALACLEASDKAEGQLETPLEHAWRHGLVNTLLEVYTASK